MKALDEIKVGKHGIGYVSDDFKKAFKDVEIEERIDGPFFQRLGRNMNDATIESELKPGFCDLSDILAFLKNPQEETKDGWSNLFYTPSLVVLVYWHGGEWRVDAWGRDGRGWRAENRVFSPATVARNSDLGSSTLGLSFAEQLEEVLDREFPKGACKERGGALMLFAEAVRLHRK